MIACVYVLDFSVCFLTVVMLKWFVDAEVAAGAIEQPRKLIEEENVEVRPEQLPDALLDENVDVNVDVNLIRRFLPRMYGW